MNKDSIKSPEKDTSPSREDVRKFDSGETRESLPKQPFESTSSKAVEYIDLGESAEVSGEVSEVLREQSEQKSDGVFAKKSRGRDLKRMTAAQIKSHLLKKAPPQSVIIKQVKREIEKEINYLNKRARKIVRKPGAVNAFELNNVVKKIRELKELLLTLVKASSDALKTLWLRFVHGVM